MANNAHSIDVSPETETISESNLRFTKGIHKIKLCESTLQLQTRDVYGKTLPKGQWKCTIKHNGVEDLRLDIKTFDQTSYQWSSVTPEKPSRIHPEMTNLECDFSVKAECEVKFIIFSDSAKNDIQYRCDLSSIPS